MTRNIDEAVIRQYLLGELTQDDVQQIEERLMTDDDFVERVLLAQEDIIDEYLDGTLSEQNRWALESSFLKTKQGRAALEFAKALRRQMSQEAQAATKQAATKLNAKMSVRRSWHIQDFRTHFQVAAAALLVLVAGLALWRYVSSRSDLDKGNAALARAFSRERPLETRVSGLSYAPYIGTRGDRPAEVDQTALNLAERLLLNEADRHPIAESDHALGRLFLLEKKFDRAVQTLEAAAKADPKNAAILGDLGAAYVERSFVNPDKPDFAELAKALELLNEALKLNDSLLSCRFNRALSLQRSNAAVKAREAWEDYLQHDADSEWATEARRNLRLLQSQGYEDVGPDDALKSFVSAYRNDEQVQAWRIESQTKEMITGTMIAFRLAREVTKASLSNRGSEGTEFLNAFRFLGTLEEQRAGDPFFSDLAQFYSSSNLKNLRILLEAHQAQDEAYSLCLRGRYRDALPSLESARRLFQAADNNLEARVVDYWRAYCFSYGGELRKSSAILDELREDCERNSYRWLECQAYGWLANNNALQGEYSKALELNKNCLRIARQIDDLYAVQKASSQVADNYRFFGRNKEALEFNRQSLPSPNDFFVSRRQLWRSLFSLTDTLYRLRFYRAAEAFEHEALELARKTFGPDAALMHSTYRRLGQIYIGEGDFESAGRSLVESIELLEPLEPDPICSRLRGLSMLQIANMKRLMGDYPAAIEDYRHASTAFEATELSVHRYESHKGMLLCYLLNKDADAIETEMPLVLALFEKNRQKIKEEQNRNPFFDTEQGVYDLAIEYKFEADQREQSFYYSELSRARSLQDEIVGRLSAGVATDADSTKTASEAIYQPLTLDNLKQRLPDNVELVEYSVLNHRLLIWIVGKKQFEVIPQAVTQSALEELSNNYLEALMASDEKSLERETRLAAELYDWLLEPVQNRVDRAAELVIVPDKCLFKVPFAALLCRGSGKRALLDHNMLYSPSASVFVLCSEQAASKAGLKQGERLLCVGDPRFDSQSHQGLKSLPSAAVEARDVAALYQDPLLLIGENATKAQIATGLQSCDVLHFAGHFVPDDLDSGRSRMVLAGNHANSNPTVDSLSLDEIAGMKLPNARLAVLSSCQSGIERYYAGEGLIGLSRAFLMAGVPMVIASQWSVETDATSELMIKFHAFRKLKGVPSTDALRQAQLAMLDHPNERYRRPYYWAAFFPIGGHASY